MQFWSIKSLVILSYSWLARALSHYLPPRISQCCQQYTNFVGIYVHYILFHGQFCSTQVRLKYWEWNWIVAAYKFMITCFSRRRCLLGCPQLSVRAASHWTVAVARVVVDLPPLSSPPTPSATHKPRKTVRRVKANESTGSSDSHSSSRSKNSVSPLTAGELLLVFSVWQILLLILYQVWVLCLACMQVPSLVVMMLPGWISTSQWLLWVC